MALFVKQPDHRSEMQNKIAADLQGKLHEQSRLDSPSQPDPEMLKDKKQSKPAGLIFGIAVLIAVIVTIVILVFSL